MQLPLKGAEGLHTHYLAIESACLKGGTVRLEQLKPLKMFAWLLSSKQQSTVTKWIQTAPRAGISNAMLTGKASTLASPLLIKAPPTSFKTASTPQSLHASRICLGNFLLRISMNLPESIREHSSDLFHIHD